MDSTSSLAASAAGAFTLGLTGSLHCLVMCGPLACASLPAGGSRWRASLAYQGARLVAYGAVGAALGALGRGATRALSVSTQPSLPWLMAAALVVSALGLGKRLPPIPGLSRLSGALARRSARFSPPFRAAAIGALTPLLPCGLLYGTFAVALAAGGVGGGALVLGAFAVGGLPALLAAQAGLWRQRPRRVELLLQRGVPLLAAAVLVYRALEVGAGRACH